MKVLELRGYRSLRAFQAFHTLMLGLKMLPAYAGEQYAEFYARVELMPPEDQAKMIREAAMFVELQKDEVEALAAFCTDANGIPYGPENLKNMGPGELVDMIVAVCSEVAKIKINFVTEAEKKN